MCITADYEWVTNTPFELIDKRNWQLLEYLPRIRISRSETKTKLEDQQSIKPGRESSSAFGEQTKTNSQLPEDTLEIFSEPKNSTSENQGSGTNWMLKQRRLPATHVVIAHTEGQTCYKKQHCLQVLRHLHVRLS